MHPMQVELVAAQTAHYWAQTKLAETQQICERMRGTQLFLELSQACVNSEVAETRAARQVVVAGVLQGSLQKFCEQQLSANPAQEEDDAMYLTVEQILVQKGLAQGAVMVFNPIFGTDLKRAYVGQHKREPRSIPGDFRDICTYHTLEDAKLIDASWEVFKSRDKYAETMRRERGDEFLETVRRYITQGGNAPGYKTLPPPPRKSLTPGGW